MRRTESARAWRAAALALAAAIAVLGIAVAGQAASKVGSRSTYGIVQSPTGKLTAVRKPKSFVEDSVFSYIGAFKIAKWHGWGKPTVTARAKRVKTCEVDGHGHPKPSTCSTAKGGTVVFSGLVTEKCNVHGHRKKVGLYEASTITPDGGAGQTTDVFDCPKF